MFNGRKPSGSGSNWSQPKIFPPGTGSSDSSSALTMENVKRLEKEYTTSEEAFNKQRIQDYIKQTNLALFNNKTTRKTSTEVVWEAESEGPSSSFPANRSENSKEVCWKTSEKMSRKDKLLRAPATDSPSTRLTGSKPKESKQRVDDYPASCCSMEDEMTQTEWSYSDESLAAREDVIGEEKSSEPVGGGSSPKPTEGKAVEVLSRDTKVYPEAREKEGPVEAEEEAAAEDGEENNQAGLCDKAVQQPVEPAQASPRPESDEEPLSMGGEHEDDGTAAALCPGELPAGLNHNIHEADAEFPLSSEETTWMEKSEKCTFCSAPEKPVPTVVDLKEQHQENMSLPVLREHACNLFCCRRYKEVFVAVIQELMSKDKAEEKLVIISHSDPSQAELRSSIKEKLLKQLDEGGFENYREIFQQYLRFVARTRIFFRLSKNNEYAVGLKTTPFKKHRLTSAPLEDLLEPDSEFVAVHLKHCRSEPVRRSYPDGRTFSLLFPDGSGQVYYPSGHVAILIMFSKEALFTYCVLEDSRYPGIRAAFRTHGHGVCIHPDGQLWATLDPCTGICLDQTGACQKRWKWHDFSHHVHSPPFQSITMKLNNYITIKILAQDQIDLLFTSSSDSIRFNVGSRLKWKDPDTSHLLKRPESEEELFLQSKKIQLRSLLSKIQTVLQYFWQPLSQ